MKLEIRVLGFEEGGKPENLENPSNQGRDLTNSTLLYSTLPNKL